MLRAYNLNMLSNIQHMTQSESFRMFQVGWLVQSWDLIQKSIFLDLYEKITCVNDVIFVLGFSCLGGMLLNLLGKWCPIFCYLLVNAVIPLRLLSTYAFNLRKVWHGWCNTGASACSNLSLIPQVLSVWHVSRRRFPYWCMLILYFDTVSPLCQLLTLSTLLIKSHKRERVNSPDNLVH